MLMSRKSATPQAAPRRARPGAWGALALLGALNTPIPAAAQTAAPRHAGGGKLLLTGGVSSIDGAAGGGLTPWAVTGSYASDHEFGATAFATHLGTPDYAFTAAGMAATLQDLVEVSLARQTLNAGAVVPGARLRLDVAGIKVRVAGDAVLDSDRWMPQIALGAESKHVDPGAAVGAVLDSVAASRSGVDWYASATKLLLAQGVLLNGTLRATQANQNGLLGFGSAQHHADRLEPEASVAYLLNRHLAVGAEYRAKPNQLAYAGAALREDAWQDLFAAWAPNKHVSVTAAWVDLGNIVGHEHQRGAYVSLQLAD